MKVQDMNSLLRLSEFHRCIVDSQWILLVFLGGFVMLHVGRAVELKIDVEVRGTSVLTSFLTSSGGSTASSRKMPQVVKGIDIYMFNHGFIFGGEVTHSQ